MQMACISPGGNASRIRRGAGGGRTNQTKPNGSKTLVVAGSGRLPVSGFGPDHLRQCIGRQQGTQMCALAVGAALRQAVSDATVVLVLRYHGAINIM